MAALESLPGDESAAIHQLELNRDAAVAQVLAYFAEQAEHVKATVASYRLAIETDLVRLDTVLEEATDVSSALEEVRDWPAALLLYPSKILSSCTARSHV